ncbi:glycosyltransferase family 4 protein [Bacteroides gallinaceum]|uniref:Glycosyltransferase family 4 protein n=1 Tax=Bacteroides gallinaceum TaxID=1462571 RepID=A0ABT7VIM1_9BACE|nr:glycosyltransferase family 4 protein [Bacteroides gallinaceum]MDM8326142.1 glycosyltransferase family 4 protein [Bacteroides gallinaceum]
MKKLLIFHPYLATYRIDLYNRFTKDFEVKVILTGHPKEISGLGFNLEKVNTQAKFNYKYYNQGIYIGRHLLSSIYLKTIKEFQPDIVLAHEYGINTLAAIAGKSLYNYKLFLTCDDSLQMAEGYSRKRKLLRNFIVKHVDGFLVVSTKTQEFLNHLYSNSHCKFIYFPIIQDDKYLEQKINSCKEKAQEYNHNYSLEDKKILLYVGRFDPVKNLPLLLKAYAHTKANNNRLVLVGDGEMKFEVNKLIQELKLNNNVIQTGALYGNDLYAWYYLADFSILASYQEAFGAVVNEALAGGCFAIVSDHAGAHTLIQNNINGFTFKSGDEKDLIEKLALTFKRQKKNTISSIMPKPFEEFYQELLNAFNTQKL